MNPGIDLRLRVATNAMSNVAAQQKDGGTVAAEQLHLAMATVNQVREILPAAQAIARGELNATLTMAREIAAAMSDTGLEPAIETAAAVEAKGPSTPIEMDDARADLLAAVCDVLDTRKGDPNYKVIARIALVQNRKTLDFGRAAWLGSGFETEPSEVARLEKMRASLFNN
ncbi:MAG: hypothetical protein KDE63_05230 [Novosphingobium sp.]|nr:hypothetical protein [Novosphingobium sp.]